MAQSVHVTGPTTGSESPDTGDRQSVLPGSAAATRRRRRLRLTPNTLLQGTGWTLLRLASDALALCMGNVAALVGAPAANASLEAQQLIWLQPPLVIVLLGVWGMYRHRTQARALDGFGQLVAAGSLAAISIIAAAALIDPGAEPAALVARAWLFGTVYLIGGRFLLGWIQRSARSLRLVAKPTLIVGAGHIGARVERRLRTQPELGLLPVGYLDNDPQPADQVMDRLAPVLGGIDDLRRTVAETGAKHVVLGFSTAPDRTLLPFVRECEALGLEVSLVPRLFESVNVHLAVDHLGGLPLFGLHTIDPKGWQFTVKHALDRVVAAIMVISLTPFMLVIAVAVKLSSPGPVLFRQWRIGRDGREFTMFKFRSMRMAEELLGPQAEEAAPLGQDTAPGGVEGSDRRTRVGRFLRRASLDELPQLFNVLRGDMSLVGPRPERPEYAEVFGAHVTRYNDRHRVKSGLTGWAQVNGFRGQTSLADRVEWDNYYVQNWSLSLDLKILFMTIGTMSKRAE